MEFVFWVSKQQKEVKLHDHARHYLNYEHSAEYPFGSPVTWAMCSLKKYIVIGSSQGCLQRTRKAILVSYNNTFLILLLWICKNIPCYSWRIIFRITCSLSHTLPLFLARQTHLSLNLNIPQHHLKTIISL